jgi:23S rRNA (uracil1939-C5)-methyltransferase
MQKNPQKTHIVDVKKLGVNGEGIGFINRIPIFIPRTLPYETVEVAVTKTKPLYMEGDLISIKKEAKERIIPLCPYFDQCGGCDLQHAVYEDGLFYKRLHLVQTLEKYTDEPQISKKVLEYEASRKPFEYRNKAQLPIRLYRGKPSFGLYKRNSNHLLFIESCPVQHPRINQVFTWMMKHLETSKVQAFDPKTRTGHVKGMMVRIGHETMEVQVVILLTKKVDISSIALALSKEMKDVVSVYETISESSELQDYTNETTRCISGKETMDTRINEFTYTLYPESFFQLNSIMAETFYSYMIEVAKLKSTDVVVDAYAGVGTISHVASPFIRKGFAIDSNPKATENARDSLARHGIEHVKVITGDTMKVLKAFKYNMDVIFLDPPRTGLGKDLVSVLKKMKPKKIIYGSCNPATLGKDLKDLKEMYHIHSIKPFDMFPQTAQIESVTLLSLKTL